MKTIRTRSGPFSERPHFKAGEIERMCVEELRRERLLPSEPSAIRIDRFIERRFKITHEYEELPDGVLGFTKFGRQGVDAIVVATHLDNDAHPPTRRRLRSTLAHEAGHALLHTYLFALGTKPAELFGGGETKPEILCRDVQGEQGYSGYDGRWWEYQANRAIGGLLLPRSLVDQASEPYCSSVGSLGGKEVPEARREEATRALAEIFDVNPAVVRIRLGELFPLNEAGQLSF